MERLGRGLLAGVVPCGCKRSRLLVLDACGFGIGAPGSMNRAIGRSRRILGIGRGGGLAAVVLDIGCGVNWRDAK